MVTVQMRRLGHGHVDSETAASSVLIKRATAFVLKVSPASTYQTG